MSDEYPDSDSPLPFYFNGEAMPKWGAYWALADIVSFLEPQKNTDHDVGHRDIYIIYRRIDHVGVVESADPDLFLYAVQEVLLILLNQPTRVISSLGQDACLQPQKVYEGLLEAALGMRELTHAQRRAFWTSGHEADRLRLLEVMRRCELPAGDAEFLLPPHLRQLRWAA